MKMVAKGVAGCQVPTAASWASSFTVKVDCCPTSPTGSLHLGITTWPSRAAHSFSLFSVPGGVVLRRVGDHEDNAQPLRVRIRPLRAREHSLHAALARAGSLRSTLALLRGDDHGAGRSGGGPIGGALRQDGKEASAAESSMGGRESSPEGPDSGRGCARPRAPPLLTLQSTTPVGGARPGWAR